MILIDTNILIFAHNADSPHHKQAQQLMRDAMESKFESCISQQNLLEFFSIITNPKRVEKPFSSKEALSLLENYQFSNTIIKCREY